MKISEIAKITGIKSDTIRYYEKIGLLLVKRSDNSYREYLEADVQTLLQIRFLRRLGIGISDIKLWQNRLLSDDDLISKRMHELENEKQTNQQQLLFCRQLLSEKQLDLIKSASEAEKPPYEEASQTFDSSGACNEAVSVGIDIGTSSLKIAVLRVSDRTPCECFSVPNHCDIPQTKKYRRCQSVSKITEKIFSLLKLTELYYKNIICIGITGQMHGILYVDRRGKAVSELYTWQDKSGDQPLPNGQTVCRMIEQKSGESVATGYGLVTHFCLLQSDEVPKEASTLCTIMDYLAMQLTGRTYPLTHNSIAASLGFFDVLTGHFRLEALNKLGIDSSILPQNADKAQIAGFYKNIPVLLPLGDSQASLLCAAGNDANTVLLNIGTGSQLSTVLSDPKDAKTGDGIELRPYINGSYQLCYAALCGGAGYALLENFIRRLLVLAGEADESRYALLEKMAQSADPKCCDLTVNTQFSGTRSDPLLRGSIEHISTENFTPENLAYGFLCGIVEELYQKYKQIFPSNETALRLVVTGNAIRKNPVLQAVIKDRFGIRPILSPYSEEAAFGAALYALMFKHKDNS